MLNFGTLKKRAAATTHHAGFFSRLPCRHIRRLPPPYCRPLPTLLPVHLHAPPPRPTPVAPQRQPAHPAPVARPARAPTPPARLPHGVAVVVPRPAAPCGRGAVGGDGGGTRAPTGGGTDGAVRGTAGGTGGGGRGTPGGQTGRDGRLIVPQAKGGF